MWSQARCDQTGGSLACPAEITGLVKYWKGLGFIIGGTTNGLGLAGGHSQPSQPFAKTNRVFKLNVVTFDCDLVLVNSYT